MASLANYLSEKLRELAFAAGGPAGAVDPERIHEVDIEQIAGWITELHPRRRYPAVLIRSINGALAQACVGNRCCRKAGISTRSCTAQH